MNSMCLFWGSICNPPLIMLPRRVFSFRHYFVAPHLRDLLEISSQDVRWTAFKGGKEPMPWLLPRARSNIIVSQAGTTGVNGVSCGPRHSLRYTSPLIGEDWPSCTKRVLIWHFHYILLAFCGVCSNWI